MVQLTEAGFQKLQKECDELLNNKRPAAVDRLSQARSMGDLSENSDYHQAKEQLEFIDGRIVELELVLKQAVVVKGNHSSKEVGVGAKVKVSISGAEHTFNIVGEWEADPKEKKISHESPLGKALIGRKVGETVEVQAPAGKVEYTIVGIE
ncbi:MAG: transcription elongation factor GreA [Candidatus Blackburnbacteria bacterium]|nr:transcription elongation factor GreA [Candidatus Blackburnbacteria bacterium]